MKVPWWVETSRMLIIITYSPFTGGVGGYQAVYLGRNELTQSTCQHLVFVVTSSTFFFQRCLLQWPCLEGAFWTLGATGCWETNCTILPLLQVGSCPPLFKQKLFKQPRLAGEKWRVNTQPGGSWKIQGNVKVCPCPCISCHSPITFNPPQLISLAPGGILRGSAALFTQWTD